MTTENFWMLGMLALFGLFLRDLKRIAKDDLENSDFAQIEIERLTVALKNAEVARDIWHNLWFSLQVEEPKVAETEVIGLPQLHGGLPCGADHQEHRNEQHRNEQHREAILQHHGLNYH